MDILDKETNPMKKMLMIVVVAVSLFLTGCYKDSKVENDNTIKGTNSIIIPGASNQITIQITDGKKIDEPNQILPQKDVPAEKNPPVKAKKKFWFW